MSKSTRVNYLQAFVNYSKCTQSLLSISIFERVHQHWQKQCQCHFFLFFFLPLIPPRNNHTLIRRKNKSISVYLKVKKKEWCETAAALTENPGCFSWWSHSWVSWWTSVQHWFICAGRLKVYRGDLRGRSSVGQTVRVWLWRHSCCWSLCSWWWGRRPCSLFLLLSYLVGCGKRFYWAVRRKDKGKMLELGNSPFTK